MITLTMFLKTTSHRSRDSLDSFLGHHPQYYYTWKLGGCIAGVTDEEYNRLIEHGIKQNKYCGNKPRFGKFGIKGITLYRGKDEPSKCWSTK